MEFLHSRDREKEFTFNDTFLVPFNAQEGRILLVASWAEKLKFSSLADRIETLSSMSSDESKLLLKLWREFHDLKIELSDKYWLSGVVSRDDVDFVPRDFHITWSKIPIVASNMNNVSGKRMVEAMGRLWGFGALPQDMSDEDVKKVIEYMKTRHLVYRTPVTLKKGDKVADFMEHIYTRDLDSAVIVDDNWVFIWIVSKEDADKKELYWMHIDSLINTVVKTAKKWVSWERAIKMLQKNPQNILPILDNDRKVIWVLSKKSAAYWLRYEPNNDKKHWWLWVLATVWAFNNNPLDKVRSLIGMWVRWIILDTAHLDQWVEAYRHIQAVADLIAQERENIFLVAWNVVTAKATISAISAWADIVKVWIWPWAMCSTRMETWVWRPQLSAVWECARVALKRWKYVWSDWWIKYPRDVALALALWASQVMVWTMFAGTYESPPMISGDNKVWLFKITYWMASLRAAVNRNVWSLIRGILRKRSEWSWSGRVYLGNMPSVNDRVHKLMDWLTSAMTYTGSRDLEEFFQHGIVGIQTWQWFQEWKPVDSM